RAYFRYRQFDIEYLATFEHVLDKHLPEIVACRQRSIETLTDEDAFMIEGIFKELEAVLGPVGTAKCLHIIAPAFFPLWDRAIARAYGLALGVSKQGKNPKRYFDFMTCAKQQIESLGGKKVNEQNPLKAIDEYNYWTFTLKPRLERQGLR